MRYLWKLMLCLALSLSPAFAHDYTRGAIFLDHPWSRAMPQSATVAAGYVVIKNKGRTADRLIGGTAEIAGRVEIHEMTVIDGIMKMRPLPRGVEIKARSTATLKPGGYHIMFMDLKRPLKEGERFKGTLVFEKAGTIEVEFAVEAMGAMHQH
jgi:copper(I)-binding protein